MGTSPRVARSPTQSLDHNQNQLGMAISWKGQATCQAARASIGAAVAYSTRISFVYTCVYIRKTPSWESCDADPNPTINLSPALRPPVRQSLRTWGRCPRSEVNSPSKPQLEWIHLLPLGLYKRLFYLCRSCTNQSSFYSFGPPTLPTLLQYYCTAIGQYTTPSPTPLCMPYIIQYY